MKIPTRRVDYSEVFELAEEGRSQTEIATLLCIHQSSVSRILAGEQFECEQCGAPVSIRKRRDRRLCRACWLTEVTKP